MWSETKATASRRARVAAREAAGLDGTPARPRDTMPFFYASPMATELTLNFYFTPQVGIITKQEDQQAAES